ncbi:tetrapyrrole-binding protein [Pyrus ussuriensis x Pyrus communis]|uniref:Tetrapyrrole-binding protein n=1 Tax=Pyrus ussuriensis x Pyrus communis TaxID=2448454 RepID=A0A5N5H4P9_9ROSA|nr:tetrapyrrole-binding protein [Pyrus ussuriensis x Pyrus communis]
MAAKSFQSIRHNHHSPLLHHHHIDNAPSTFFLKPTTTNTLTSTLSHPSLFSTKTFSISATTSFSTPSSSTQATSFDLLEQHLSAQNFREADEETRRLLIVLAGEQAQKRGYVFFSEVQFISEADLQAIDALWRQHSNNKFGYSVQKKIYDKVGDDFTKFFIKVGWMKKLDTEVLQYNYRAFPGEFIWELNESTPEGHLPLTNALRGTQLLKSILNHPAFKPTEEEVLLEKAAAEAEGNIGVAGLKGFMDGSKSKRVLKSDYSF